MTWSSWLLKRALPYVLLVVGAGFISGVARGFLGFVPGVQAIIIGGLLGYITGRSGRGDPENFWSFGVRIALSLIAVVLFYPPHLLALTARHAESFSDLFTWLIDILDGTTSEPFAGLAGQPGYRHVVKGGLKEVWWLVFNLLDMVIFAFLFLATTIMGYMPSEPNDEDEDDEGEEKAPAAKPRFCPKCGTPLEAAGGRFCGRCGQEL